MRSAPAERVSERDRPTGSPAIANPRCATCKARGEACNRHGGSFDAFEKRVWDLAERDTLMAVGIPLGVVAVLILLTITGVIPGLLRGSRVLLFGDPSPSAAARVAAIAQNDIAAEIAIMDETDTVYAAEATGRCQTGLDLPCVRAMPEYAIIARTSPSWNGTQGTRCRAWFSLRCRLYRDAVAGQRRGKHETQAGSADTTRGTQRRLGRTRRKGAGRHERAFGVGGTRAMLSSLRPLPQKRYRWCNPRLAALVSVALFATTTTVALAMTGVRPSTTNTTEAFTLTAASGDFDCPFGTLEAPFNNYVVATGAPFTVPVGTLATGLTLLSGGMTVTWASPQADPAGVDAYLILEPFGDPAGFTVNAGGMSMSSAFPTKTDARGPSGFPMLEERAGAFAPRLVFSCKANSATAPPATVHLDSGSAKFRLVLDIPATVSPPKTATTILDPTSANPHTCQLTHGRTAAALVPTTAVGRRAYPWCLDTVRALEE